MLVLHFKIFLICLLIEKIKKNGLLKIKNYNTLREEDMLNLTCCMTKEQNLDYKLVVTPKGF